MHIVFFINSLENAGGSERMTVLLANELVKRGYKISVICWQDASGVFFELSKEITVYYLFKKKLSNIFLAYPATLFKFFRRITSLRPDFIIDVCSAMSLVSLPTAKVLLGIPVITWEHFNSKINWNPVTSPAARWLSSKLSKLIVVLTSDDETYFKKKYSAKNVITIYNPVTANQRISYDPNRKVILTIGRLTHQKGFDILIDIWKKLHKRFPDWKVIIVGEGELKSELQTLIKEMKLENCIEIKPFEKNIIRYYEQCSMYAMTSRFEGLPLVLIEACANGIPIISFDCETGPKHIVENGVNGFLIPAFDKAAYANCLSVLIEDMELRKKFSANAVLYSNKFAKEEILEKWINIFENKRFKSKTLNISA